MFYAFIIIFLSILSPSAFASLDMLTQTMSAPQGAAQSTPAPVPATVKKTIIQTPVITQADLLPDGVPLPFGYNLFSTGRVQSDRTGISSYYRIAPGDRVKVNIWGAVSSQSVMVVDPQGNIFIPEVGPVQLSGIHAKDLNQVIQSHIRKVYQNNVEVYINLEDRVPISVFVSGAVKNPARYAGQAGDSVIDYLSKAGGIDLRRGSFRNIKIRRRNQTLEQYDLYDFILNGDLPRTLLREGDSLVVGPKGPSISALGATDNAFAYELKSGEAIGRNITRYVRPHVGTTHVHIAGFRKDTPIQKRLSYDEFLTFSLTDKDKVTFEQGRHLEYLNVHISGKHKGYKSIVLPHGTRLYEVLQNTPVIPNISKIEAIYIKRKSVARRQKKSLQDSIKRLQETLLLARASGKTQTTPVGEGELKLLESFISQTENLNPEGRVVVIHNGRPMDILLEEGDEIIIPQQSDLVTVTGEVHLPKAIAWHDDMSAREYIERSGGFTDNANESDFIIMRASGEAAVGNNKVMAGDQIIVMPEVKINNLDLAASVADILYKAVLAVAIPIGINN